MPQASFTLIPSESSAPSSGGAAALPSSSPIDSILGFGLVSPFIRGASDFASAGGEALVRACAGNVLGIRANTEQSRGELKWRHAMGSKMHLIRHRKGRVAEDIAIAFAQEAIDLWEPRLIVTGVETTFDPQSRARTVIVYCDFISQNVPGNNVVLRNIRVTLPFEET